MTATISSHPTGAGNPPLTTVADGRLPSGASWHPAVLASPLALAVAVWGLAVRGSDAITARDIVLFALIVTWAAAGVLLASRQPLCRLGVVLLGGTLLGAIGFAGAEAAAAGWTSTGADVARAGRDVALLVLPAVGLHTLLALPGGSLATRSRQVPVIAGYAAAVVGAVVIAAAGRHGPAVALVWAAWIAASSAGIPGAHATYLHTAGLERQRLQWVGCGGAITLQAAVVLGALHLLVDWPRQSSTVALAFTALVPIALAAGSSPRLAARVDRLLVHTVSLTGVTAVTVAVYLFVVVGLGRIPDRADRNLLGLSMAAAALAAMAYVPARDRLGDLANRLVYGERHAPDEVLRTFGSRLSRAIPMDELLLQLAESLRKTLSLTRAEVWTGTPALLERTISVPFREPDTMVIGDKERPVIARAGVSGQAWMAVWLPALLEDRPRCLLRAAPITHSGELLGLIVVERPGDGDAFTADDDQMLTELARQVGLALHNVQLDSALQATLDEVRRTNDELRASRARIVATGDAERRKIERNLHDGAQQHLVALAVNLRLARDLLTDDPKAVGEMLDQLADDVKETVQELRNLAHGIFPPLLMDAGLRDALRAAANRNPLDVEVEAEDIGRYQTEIEAAIYFCCLEALQNASKHAPGSSAKVRVWEDEGGLLFEVADDGPGFDVATATAGHGYANMNDRLGAIGGSVRWESTPGSGTRISGAVPLVSATSNS